MALLPIIAGAGCAWPVLEIVLESDEPASAPVTAAGGGGTGPAPVADDGRRYSARTLEELNAIQWETTPYRLRPGDRVEIIVWNQPQLSKEISVRPDGRITFPYVDGELQAAGLTFAELSGELSRRLADYFTDPQVALMAVRLAEPRVTILGQVRLPGSITIRPGDRVLDVLGRAGGLLQINFTQAYAGVGVGTASQIHAADLDAAYISRDGELLPVDFRALIEDSNFVHNIPILDGDFIWIPSIETSKKNIYVFGPDGSGVIPVTGTTTMVEVMARTVGWSNRADNLNVLVVRATDIGPVSTIVDFSRILHGRDPAFELQGGDIVLVPRTTLTTLEEFARQFGNILNIFPAADNARDATEDW